MLLQEAVTAGAHPLSGTAASFLWLLPLLPLLGFVLNGLLSLIPAYHAGPADPQASHGDHAGAPEPMHTLDESGGGGHGDDHHEIKRHRYASLVSLIGPGGCAFRGFSPAAAS